MSGLRDTNELEEVAQNIGSSGNHLEHRHSQETAGEEGDGEHLLLSATQKAVRNLVSALEEDGEG